MPTDLDSIRAFWIPPYGLKWSSDSKVIAERAARDITALFTEIERLNAELMRYKGDLLRIGAALNETDVRAERYLEAIVAWVQAFDAMDGPDRSDVAYKAAIIQLWAIAGEREAGQ